MNNSRVFSVRTWTAIVAAAAILTLMGAAPGALADIPCEHCARGANWINSCTLAGYDEFSNSGAEVGIYLPPDCSGEPANFVLSGPATIRRDSSGGSNTIATEIVSMNLTGGGLTLLVGTAEGLTRASRGTITEQAEDNKWGDSFFDVYLEAVVLDIGTVWNHDAFEVTAVIDCVPPDAVYIHPQGQCVPLYDDPDDDEGDILAYLGDANHITFPGCGDGWCDSDEEDTCTCPSDCGPHCGDGTCNCGEIVSSCPQDCGGPGCYCGDGSCNCGENCSSCPSDCGHCPNGAIPTVSEWGLIVLTLLGMTIGTVMFARRRGNRGATTT